MGNGFKWEKDVALLSVSNIYIFIREDGWIGGIVR